MEQPETGKIPTPDEIRAKLEEATAWWDSISNFASLEDFKDWGLTRLSVLEKQVEQLPPLPPQPPPL